MARSRSTGSTRVSSWRISRLLLTFRLAFIGLRRTPGSTLLATLILTLGLAAPTVFFSLLVGAIRPLPVPDGDRFVRVDVVQPSIGGGSLGVRGEELNVLQGAGTLEGLGGFELFIGTLVEPGRAAARFGGAVLTPEVLPLLQVAPILGRVPGPAEGVETILLGHRLWVDDFQGDPGILGRTVYLDGAPRTIVGVMPEGFAFPFNQRAWVIEETSGADQEAFQLVGKLASGASETSAETELSARWARMEGSRVPERRGGAIQVGRFTAGRGGGGEGLAFLGLVLVALALLFIACTNVANLLLARATERVGNLAVQAALGAGRLQISAQIFLESAMVAVLGGVGGTALAWVVVGAIERALAEEHFGFFWMAMEIDLRVLGFVALLVVGTALLSGLLPVLRVMKADLHGVLKGSAPGVGIGGLGGWGRRFVTTQLALSCGALVAAGLAVASMTQTAGYGKGLKEEEILLASLSKPADRGLLWSDVEGAFEAFPGGLSVALGVGAPGFGEPMGTFEMVGEEVQRPQDRSRTRWNAVSPAFFSAFDLSLLEGRGLRSGDGPETPRVAVVSEGFVRRFFPRGEVLGRRLRLAVPDSASEYTVVGIVENLILSGAQDERVDRVYLPLAQVDPPEAMALIRGAEVSPELVSELRRRVAGVSPDMPVWGVQTLAEAFRYLTRVYRAMAGMAVGGGAAGLLVAVVGLYGLLAFWVRERRRELGIRKAVGAGSGTLAVGVFWLALRRVLPAVVVGMGLAWIAAPLVSIAFLGGDPRSPVVYLGVAGVFLAAGAGAAAVPAYRAWAVEPAEVLRGE